MSWEKYENAARKGPGPIAWKFFWFAISMLIVVGLTLYAVSLWNEAAMVAKQEFGAKAALKKYEWFVDQANRIKEMDGNIGLYEQRVKSVRERYVAYGEDQAKWPPHAQIQYQTEYNRVKDDLLAIIAQRNHLVQEYNSASQKFNWAPFQTRPDKPQKNYFQYITDY